MKTAFLLLLVAVLTFGCASRYDITTTNGTVITSKTKPRLSDDKNVWYFTDMNGKSSRIAAGSVEQVSPQSLGSDNKYQFKKSN